MKHYTVFRLVAVVAVVLIVILDQVNSECCNSRSHPRYGGQVCGDCSKPTPCCGYRKCNIFCCACIPRDNGRVCRFGACFLQPGKKRSVEVTNDSTCGEDVVVRADVNYDGVLSVEEAMSYLNLMNMTLGNTWEKLTEMDKNKDEKLSAEEIDYKD